MYVGAHHPPALDPPTAPVSPAEKANPSPHPNPSRTAFPAPLHSPLHSLQPATAIVQLSSNAPNHSLPRACVLADPSTWKTLFPKLHPTHHHFIEVSNLTSSERPCQLVPRPLTLLYFSSEHLLLSEIILDVCLLICFLSPPSD